MPARTACGVSIFVAVTVKRYVRAGEPSLATRSARQSGADRGRVARVPTHTQMTHNDPGRGPAPRTPPSASAVGSRTERTKPHVHNAQQFQQFDGPTRKQAGGRPPGGTPG